MKSYYLKWILVSLVAPIVVLLTSELAYSADAQMLLLAFWPTSIMLMSLGGNEIELGHIVYVWTIAVITNVILYALVGFFVSLIKGFIKREA